MPHRARENYGNLILFQKVLPFLHEALLENAD